MTRAVSVGIAFFLLLACLVPAWPQAASVYRNLEPGLEHKQELITDGPLSIHVLRIDRSKTDWHWFAPMGEARIMGLSQLPKTIKTIEKVQKGRVVAAINGDWFEIKAGPYQGDPRGLQIVDGELVSAPAAEFTVFSIDAEGQPRMGVVSSRFRVVWPEVKKDTPLGLNEHRPDDKAVLYTPALGHDSKEFKTDRKSTRTIGGRELILEPTDAKNWQPFEVGKTYSTRVVEIRESGDTSLKANSVILSIGTKLVASVPEVEIGTQLLLRMETVPDLTGTRTAIGGGFHLVKDGKEQPLPKADKVRHPRSMLGWNEKHFFLVVVDGRQPKLSVGMTYFEMATLADRLGCTEAMALDGGGSSTLWADQRVLNSPSDGQPRGVANALMLMERKK